MKRVTFEIAKVIKEAGYPQGVLPQIHKVKSFPMYYNGDLVNDYEYFFDNYITIFEQSLCVACPTYLDVWLWLWREKKIAIGCPYENTYDYWFTNINTENDNSLILWKYSSGECNDPEEAIIAAIEYLVENDLIK